MRDLVQNYSGMEERSTGIGDKYFSKMMETPAMIWPRILKNSTIHLKKMHTSKTSGARGTAIYLEKLLSELLVDMKVPMKLTLPEQCEFGVGYYQQKQSFYQTKENKKSTEEANSMSE